VAQATSSVEAATGGRLALDQLALVSGFTLAEIRKRRPLTTTDDLTIEFSIVP
jgi:hypothetical protein